MKKLLQKKTLLWLLAGILALVLVLLSTSNNANKKAYPFAGSGTLSDPYLIGTVRELRLFRDLVNQGDSFQDSYFRQTRDLNLRVIEDWEPIGLPDSGHYFYGIYNGAGHVIKNLTVTSFSHGGLFGDLGGTVMNLGIEGGMITSDCAGSIASHSVGEKALILNCYSTATISGHVRAGGIADNFSDGAIIDCFTVAQIKSPLPAGICSYAADLIMSCTSIDSPLHNEIFSGDIINSTSESNESALVETLYARFTKNSTQRLSPAQQLQRTYLSGAGTAADPYRIRSAEDLNIFRYLVNAGCTFSDCYIRQEADLDLSQWDNWLPIGSKRMSFDSYSDTEHFAGIYDGAGHTISGLNTANRKHAGLFGVVTGTVMNLGIETGMIHGQHVGGIAGVGNDAQFINCYNKALLTGAVTGGIVSQNPKGSIVDCWNSGTLIGTEKIGGIATASTYIIGCTSMKYALFSPGANVYNDLNHQIPYRQINVDSCTQSFYDRVQQHGSSTRYLLDTYITGSGTREDPYHINTLDELCYFRALVNMGMTFKEKWVRQEADLDLSSVDNWCPIGVGFPFYGIYDGAGHTISNLTIYNQSKAGFFGILHGTVMNLQIASGSIAGDQVAGFAYTGEDAVIINCSNNASVEATKYGGGIASDFSSSYIINCLNTGSVCPKEDSNALTGGIVGNEAQIIVNSYSVDCDILAPDSKSLTDNRSCQISDVSQAAEKLNRYQYSATAAAGRQYLRLCAWNSDGSLGHYRNYMPLFVLQNLLTAVVFFSVIALLWLVLKCSRQNHAVSPAGLRSTLRSTGEQLRGSMDLRLRTILCGGFSLCFGMVAVAYLCSDNTITREFFLANTSDAYMDFFNPMYFIYNSNYSISGHYTNLGGTYPPVARAILWLFGKLLPFDLWDNTSFNIRSHTHGSMLFLLIVVAFFAVMYILFRKLDSRGSKALCIFCLFCSPMLFLVERGNVLMFALVLSAMFLLGYRSQKPVIRHLSYICLSLAAAIKIYPAALGILVLREKNWKHTLQCLIYGVVICIGPFFLIGGIQELRLYIRNITSSIDNNASSINSSYMNYTNTVATLGAMIFHNEAVGQIIGKYTLLPFIALLAGSALLSKEHWKAVLAATLIVLLLPGYSIYYCASIMVLPLLCFVSSKHTRRIDYAYAVGLALTVVPLQFLCGAYGASVVQVQQTAAFAALALAILVIVDCWIPAAKIYLPCIQTALRALRQKAAHFRK